VSFQFKTVLKYCISTEVQQQGKGSSKVRRKESSKEGWWDRRIFMAAFQSQKYYLRTSK